MVSIEASTESICRSCRLNRGFIPCCDKVYCEMFGLIRAKSKCKYRI